MTGFQSGVVLFLVCLKILSMELIFFKPVGIYFGYSDIFQKFCVTDANFFREPCMYTLPINLNGDYRSKQKIEKSAHLIYMQKNRFFF